MALIKFVVVLSMLVLFWAKADAKKRKQATANASERFTIPRFHGSEHVPELVGSEHTKRVVHTKRTIAKHVKGSPRELIPETITIVKNEGTINQNELPGASGDDIELPDEKENKERKKQKAKKHKLSENAATLGNNIIPLPGINPAAASNDRDDPEAKQVGPTVGVGAKEKFLDKKFRKRSKKKKIKVPEVDDTLVKQIEDIAQQIDKVENRSRAEKSQAILKKVQAKIKMHNHKIKSSESSSENADTEQDEDLDVSGFDEGSADSDLQEPLTSHAKDTSSSWPTNEDESDSLTADSTKSSASTKTSSASPPSSTSTPVSVPSTHAVAPKTDESEKIGMNASSTDAGHGDAGGPEGFECPWVCFWTCHSYCPKECCYNPFHCDTVCRTFCAPTCHDKCCAPGSHRMPNLELSFQPNTPEPKLADRATTDQTLAAGSTGGDIPGSNPVPSYMERVKAAHDREMEVRRFEDIRRASELVAKLSGYPSTCPLFCSRICTPGLCSPPCCTKNIILHTDSSANPNQKPNAAISSPSSSISAKGFPGTPAAGGSIDPVAQAAADALKGPTPSAGAPLANFIAGVQRAWQLAQTSQQIIPAQSNVAQKGTQMAPSTLAGRLDQTRAVGAAARTMSPMKPLAIPALSQKPALPIALSAPVVPASPVISAALPGTKDASPAAQARSLNPDVSTRIAPSLMNVPDEAMNASPAPALPPMDGQFTPNDMDAVRELRQQLCPPICRTSCIDECPNECCSNLGKHRQ